VAPGRERLNDFLVHVLLTASNYFGSKLTDAIDKPLEGRFREVALEDSCFLSIETLREVLE
jgi:hypothetical protein